MASYLGHISFSSVLGAGYGTVGALYLNLDWGPVFLGAGLTTIGGLLPDVDSDSGVPVRELFTLGAVLTPFLILGRLSEYGFSIEQIMVILAALYIFIRYVFSNVFKKFTVHRGIYHSLPAMLIAGLGVFLLYHGPTLELRAYLAVGTMIGFLSHLVLDELCSVDFMGAKITLNKYAGSAVKLFSPSWSVTFVAYVILAAMGWSAYREVVDPKGGLRPFRGKTVRISTPSAPKAEPTLVKEAAPF